MFTGQSFQRKRSGAARFAALSIILVTGIAGVLTAGIVQHARNSKQHADYQKEIKPVISQYCLGCHNDEKQKGDLSLQPFADVASVRAQRDTWGKVLAKLRDHEMPPENKAQPTTAERDRVIDWLNAELFPVDCEHPDPGRVTLRRLNRAEYNNTIRDLVGVDFHPADDFPADDSGYGFDNIGDVLSVSPLLIEKYLVAAEKVLDEAIVDPQAVDPSKKLFNAKEFKSTNGGEVSASRWFCLASEGEVYVGHNIETTGDYRIRVRAYGDQAGPEPVKMGLRLDKTNVHTFEVKARESAPEPYDFRVRLAAGHHRFGAAFLNDYYRPADPDPNNRDRNLYVRSVEISGPLDAPPPPLTETHRRIFIAEPSAETTNACLVSIVTRFATRAWRRPAGSQEIEPLLALSRQALREGASFEGSVKIALEAVLVSPHFLFRGELQTSPNDPRVIRPVDEYALASRLSYFIWSSMPDDELMALAEKGKLRENLEAQVRRMLASPKSEALPRNFAGQWLQIRNLKLMTPDPKTFPDFDDALRIAMERETELFFDNIMRKDRSVLEFLTADYTFANERLARHYGLSGVRGEQFQRVSLKGTPRSGVLTHASVLTVTSNPTRTSPVKRGKWVLENILAQPPPPPLPNVPPLPEGKEEVANASLRQRLEKHRQDPICASCHASMDPLGFGMEHFDGIGAWRDKDGTFAIDDAGQLKTGERFAGPVQLRDVLANRKRDDFVHCLSEKMLTYALGRGLEYYDRCAVERIGEELSSHNFRFSALVMAVVKSVPFQMRRGDGEHLAKMEK
jgi:hypothetical protein